MRELKIGEYDTYDAAVEAENVARQRFKIKRNWNGGVPAPIGAIYYGE